MGDRFPTFAELRRTRRLRLQLETSRRAGERTVHDKLFDLSSGGFSLLSAHAFAPHEVIEIRLISADHTFDIPVRGEVVHVRPSRQPGLKRVGFKFVGETPVRKLLLSSQHVLSQSRTPPRLEVGLDAVWSGPGGATTGALYLANLGLDGALVHGFGLPPVGGPLIVGIYPPESQEMVALPARVVWSNPAGEGTVAGLGFALETYTRSAVASYLESLLFTPLEPPAARAECAPETRIGGFVVGALLDKSRSHSFYRARALNPEVDAAGAHEVCLRRSTGNPRDVDLWSDHNLDAMLIGTALAHHPGVLKVFGATRERDATWLATELFPSTSFERVLAQQVRTDPAGVPVEGLVTVVEQALAALAVCHEAGDQPGQKPIVHGDLRPSAILVGDNGEVKLTGFGCIPAAVGPGDVRVPPDRLQHLPPQLFKTGGAIKPADDVFQMGVVLYEALTGTVPFDAQNPAELEKQAATGAVPPSKLNPAIGPELDAAILSALAADPAARPTNARALLDAIRAARPVGAGVTTASPAETAAPPEALPELLQKVVTRSGNHPAYDPRSASEQLAAAARAQLELDARLKVRRRGLAEGEMLGRYEVLENLARGGMAEVYRARIAGGDGTDQVVLKTIFQEDAADVGNVKLFLNEARVAVLLTHPNIVQVTDYGFDRGRPFIAMEYVHGVTLGELITVLAARGQKVPPPLAARIVSEACAGIGYAHAVRDDHGRTLELVHRDVTARNILISFGGAVKLLDFGIAKFRGSSEVTASGRVRGTSAYLAPEQIREEPVTRAIDIWALGINLYRLLTGVLPFERDTLALSITAVLQHQPPMAHEVAAGVPFELSQIADRAMKKNATERFTWAEQMRTELEKYLVGKAGAAADLKALLESTFPPGASGQRRPNTADLTPFIRGLERPGPALGRAVALMEPLGSPAVAPLAQPPSIAKAPTPPAPPAPAVGPPRPLSSPVPPGLVQKVPPAAVADTEQTIPPGHVRAIAPAPPPGASPRLGTGGSTLGAIKLVSVPASSVGPGAGEVLPAPPQPVFPPPEAALTPATAGDDLDFAVTEEPLADDWSDITRPRNLVPASFLGAPLGPEDPTAVARSDPRNSFSGETTTEISLDLLALKKHLTPRKGPLGLVSRPPAPAAPRTPAEPDPALERFGPNPAPATDPMGDLFFDEPPASAQPPAEASTSVTSPATSPFMGVTTEPVPAMAAPAQFSTAATEQVAAYRPAVPIEPGTVPGSAPPPAPPAVAPPAAPSVEEPSDAVGWMRRWCSQPDTYLVIPGEAAVPRIWVARLMLDGFLAGKPSDTTWAGFDAWARTRLGNGEAKWLGEVLLSADPERDHLNAIAALLALLLEYGGQSSAP